MTSDGFSLPHTSLLEQQAFLRRLARSLVSDPHRAEDLAQEATLAALESPPANAASMRAWLARVVRNRAANMGVSEQRRRAREQAATFPASERSPEELEEIFQVQRRVMEAVERLDEPYRSAILLRYFHDLGPTAIAARLGVPVATVKSRLARALAQLRGRIDETQPESERRWAVVLAAGAHELPKPTATAALATGGAAFAVKLALGAAACGALILGGWWLQRPSETKRASGPGDTALLAASIDPAGAEPRTLREAEPEVGRVPVTRSAEGSQSAAQQPTWSLKLELRGWSEGDQGPVALSVRSDARPLASLDDTRELAKSIVLDLGALLAQADGRPDQLLLGIDHPTFLPVELGVLVPQELRNPEARSGQLAAAVDLVRAKAIVTGSVAIADAFAGISARVAIFPLLTDRPASDPVEIVQPDAQGRFRLRADSAQRHAIVALDERALRPGGFVGNESLTQVPRPATRVEELADGEQQELGELLLGEGAAIDGRIVGGSAPISGHLITYLRGNPISVLGNLCWVDSAFELKSQMAPCTDGEFRVVGLAQAPYELRVMPGLQTGSPSTGIPHSKEREFVSSAPATGVVLTLDRMRVTFQVRGQGSPIAGAGLSVHLKSPSGMNSMTALSTDDSGNASIEIDPAHGLRVQASHPRYGSKELQLTDSELRASSSFVIEFDGAQAELAELVLAPSADGAAWPEGLRISVTLHETSTSPRVLLDHARRELTATDLGQEDLVTVRVSGTSPRIRREGATRVVSGLPGGSYFVNLVPLGKERGATCFVLGERFEVEIPAGQRVIHDWRLRLGGTVRVQFTGSGAAKKTQLLDGDEKPLDVRYQWPEASAIGGFMLSKDPKMPGASDVLPALPAGRYSLRIQMADGTSRSVPFEVEAERVNEVAVELSEP